MNEEKANALLKWVNSAETGFVVDTLQELSNGTLLLRIVNLIDKDYEAAEDKKNSVTDLCKVICFLENFYQQSITTFVDQNEITCFKNTVEIGKVVSLLLCCAVQGENVSLFVERITRLGEDIQLHLKAIIEAVLKEVDTGKINTTSVTNVLCQSETDWNSEFYSSPMMVITSPISLYNSPIKALMASPQMQSRQSQATISKLYKKLNQLQITINNQHRVQSELERELEEKSKEIECQELKINSLLKEVAKVRGLEEEIQSLSCFEKHLEDTKRECDGLKKRNQELERYKQQFLNIEKEFSDLVAEKNAEKTVFEARLKQINEQNKERISQVQSSLEEANINNNRMRIKLLEASSVEATLKNELQQLQGPYKAELEKLKAALDKSNKTNHELYRKSDEEVLRQVAREAELKRCFKEKETSFNVTIDQLQLQNLDLQQGIEQLRRDLQEKEEQQKSLESKHANVQQELKDVLGKWECLQNAFNLLEFQNTAKINELIEANKKCEDRVKESQAELVSVKEELCKKDESLYDLKAANSALIGEKIQMSDKNAEIANAFEQESLLLKASRASIRKLEDDLSRSNNALLNETELFKTEIETHRAKLSAKEDEINKLTEENENLKEDVHVKDTELKGIQMLVIKKEKEITEEKKKNEELQDQSRRLFTELEDEKERMVEMVRRCENLQNSLNVSNDDKRLLMEGNSTLKENMKQLEHCLKKSEELQSSIESLDEEKRSLMEDNRFLKESLKQQKRLFEENDELRSSLQASDKQKILLIDKNASLQNEVERLLKDYKQMQNSLKASDDEKRSLMKDNMSLRQAVEQRDHLCEESEMLRSSLQASDREKISLFEKNAILEKKTERLSKEYEVLDEQNKSLMRDILSLRESLADQDRLFGKNATLEKEIKRLTKYEVLDEETKSLMKDNASLKENLKDQDSLFEECEALRGSLQASHKEKHSLMEKYAMLEKKVESTSKDDEVLKEEKRELMEDKLSLEEGLKQLDRLSEDCGELHSSLQASDKEKTSQIGKIDSLIKEREHITKDYEALNEEKRLLMEDDVALGDRLEQRDRLTVECEELPGPLQASDQEKLLFTESNAMLKKEVVRVSKQCKVLDEVNKSLMKDNMSQQEGLQQRDRLSEKCDELHRSLQASDEEKVLLTKKVASLTKEVERLSNIYTLLQSEKVTEVELLPKDSEHPKLSLETSQENAFLMAKNTLRKNAEFVKLEDNHDKETLVEESKLFHSLTAMLAIFNELEEQPKDTKNSCGIKNANVDEVAGNLKSHFEKLINQHTQCKDELFEKEKSCLVIEEEKKRLENKLEEMEKLVLEKNESLLKMNEENVSKINELHEDVTVLKRENHDLKEIQDRRENVYLEKNETEKLKHHLESSLNEVEKLNDDCVLLKQEVLRLQNQMDVLEKEKSQFREHGTKMAENVTDLKKKLVEERIISKRLGVEVRSLEAQLGYADRQLRQKLATKDRPVQIEKEWKKTMSNEDRIFKTSVISDTSIVSDDSIISNNSIDCKLKQCNQDNGIPNDNINEERKEKDNYERTLDINTELKNVRRRSALYQTKDCHRMEQKGKRRSTVGGTFLVVDQFSTQDEPSLFGCDYDWERIVELQKRNAACLPHMRSSYPVETQVRTMEELPEEELKSGHSMSTLSRKRHRDNTSDSNLSTTFHIPVENNQRETQTLPRSKSDDSIGKRLPGKMAAKFRSLKAKETGESSTLLSSTFAISQTSSSEITDHLSRRESIAFQVDLSPPKKSRPAAQRGIHRSFGKSDLSLDKKKGSAKNTTKEKASSFRKFPLSRKTNTIKSDKKPLTARNSNLS